MEGDAGLWDERWWRRWWLPWWRGSGSWACAARPSVVAIATASRVFDTRRQRACEVPSGTGSGLVWDDAGHIVTNHHVIEAAEVRLASGHVLPARLVGTSAP